MASSVQTHSMCNNVIMEARAIQIPKQWLYLHTGRHAFLCWPYTEKKKCMCICSPLQYTALTQSWATKKSPHDLAQMRNAKWTSVVGWYLRVSTEHRTERSLCHSWDPQPLYTLLAPMRDPWPEGTYLSFPGFPFTSPSQCLKTPDPAQQLSEWASLRVHLAAVLCVVTAQDVPVRKRL